MQERKPGCICELDTETGEPLVSKYEMCPVHKSDAPNPNNTAQEIVDKYVNALRRKGAAENTIINDAVECGLLEVDAIISVLDTFQRHEYAKVLIPFYNQVKEEIEKL